jgi:hypothetical protein
MNTRYHTIAVDTDSDDNTPIAPATGNTATLMPELIPHSGNGNDSDNGSELYSRGPTPAIHVLRSNVGSKTLPTYYHSKIDAVHTNIEDNTSNPVVTYD